MLIALYHDAPGDPPDAEYTAGLADGFSDGNVIISENGNVRIDWRTDNPLVSDLPSSVTVNASKSIQAVVVVSQIH